MSLRYTSLWICHMQLHLAVTSNQQRTPALTQESPRNACAQSGFLGASDLIDQGQGPGFKKVPGGCVVKPWLITAIEHISV